MSAFADYMDLRVAVIEQVGDAGISDVLDRLTKLAEAKLGHKVRTKHQMRKRVGISAMDQLKLPADFSQMIALRDAQGNEVVARTPQSNGPGYYISGDKVVAPDGWYEVEYYTGLPTLTSSPTASNWLLQEHPSVYLYAVSVEAAKHLRDVESARAYGELLEVELREMMRHDAMSRFSRARVRVSGATP